MVEFCGFVNVSDGATSLYVFDQIFHCFLPVIIFKYMEWYGDNFPGEDPYTTGGIMFLFTF